MFLEFFFSQLSTSRQANFIKNRGILLGKRSKDGREAYVYMYRTLFAEVLFKNDNPQAEAETLKLIRGLNKLRHHFKKEMQSAF